MNKTLLVASIALCAAPPAGIAQMTLSGQTAVHFFRTAPTDLQRDVTYGRPAFGWRTDLSLNAAVNDNVAALANMRVPDDTNINFGNLFDFLAIRLTDLTPLGINIEAGKFDLPFGNLGERRFPRRNPLFGLPVIYEYTTSLPSYITTEEAVLAARGKGGGMRLLDQGMYDVGAMLYGSFGIVDYALAVTNGTISTTTYYGTKNTNSGLGTTARIAVTPTTGLTLGGAYAWGAYLVEPEQPLPGNVDVNAYAQKAAEVDIEFSRGYAFISGDVVYSRWQVPFAAQAGGYYPSQVPPVTHDEELSVIGYDVEGKYTLLPRLYVALRVSGLHFGDAQLGQVTQPWDYDVVEWEGGVGYFLDRDVLLKLVRRETRIQGGTWPKDNLTALQLVVAY